MGKTGSKPIDELIRLAVIGDGTSFTALWDAYIDQLRSFIKSWMKNLDDLYVDDICSRSFEKAFRQIHSFDPSKSGFFTWLRTIAKNTTLDVLESENRAHPRNRIVYIDDAAKVNSVVDDIQDEKDTPLEFIIREEDNAASAKYVKRLPELYRDIAELRLIKGMQYKEIADELKMELNTVRTRIRRAKAMIEQMREEDEQ